MIGNGISVGTAGISVDTVGVPASATGTSTNGINVPGISVDSSGISIGTTTVSTASVIAVITGDVIVGTDGVTAPGVRLGPEESASASQLPRPRLRLLLALIPPRSLVRALLRQRDWVPLVVEC